MLHELGRVSGGWIVSSTVGNSEAEDGILVKAV